MKYANNVIVLTRSYWICAIHLSIFIMIASQGQWLYRPNASLVTLNEMGKIELQITTRHNKAWTMCMNFGTNYILTCARTPSTPHTITSSNGNIFRVTGPLSGELIGDRLIPPQQHWRGAFMFSLIYAWANGFVNNRDAGDPRLRRAHCDVTVMTKNIVRWHNILMGTYHTLFQILAVLDKKQNKT